MRSRLLLAGALATALAIPAAAYAAGVLPDAMTPAALVNDNWQSRHCPTGSISAKCPNPGLAQAPGFPTGTAGTMVSFGDSYSAGEGDPLNNVYKVSGGGWVPSSGFYVPTDYNNEFGHNSCHRSPHAYPVIMASALSFSLDFRACSGAKTESYFRDTFDNTPIQYGASNAQRDQPFPLDTKLVTIGFGGNNVDFATVVMYCIARNAGADAEPILSPALRTFIHGLPKLSDLCAWKSADARKQITANLRPGTFGLDSLLRDITAKAPQSRVILTSYPRLFPLQRSGRTCGIGVGLATINQADRDGVNALVDELDASLREAADVAHVDFVDMSDAFEEESAKVGSAGDHGLCADSGPGDPDAVTSTATTRWVNRFRLRNSYTDYKAVSGSMHPNTLGQYAFAQRMLSCWHDQANCSNASDAGRFPDLSSRRFGNPFEGVDWTSVGRTDLGCAPATGETWNQMVLNRSQTRDVTGDGEPEIMLVGTCPTDTSAGHNIRVAVYDGASPIGRPRLLGIVPASHLQETIDLRELSYAVTDQNELIVQGIANDPAKPLAEAPSLHLWFNYQWNGVTFYLKQEISFPIAPAVQQKKPGAPASPSHTTTGTTTPKTSESYAFVSPSGNIECMNRNRAIMAAYPDTHSLPGDLVVCRVIESTWSAPDGPCLVGEPGNMAEIGSGSKASVTPVKATSLPSSLGRGRRTTSRRSTEPLST